MKELRGRTELHEGAEREQEAEREEGAGRELGGRSYGGAGRMEEGAMSRELRGQAERGNLHKVVGTLTGSQPQF